MNQREITGPGSLSALSDVLLESKRVFLVVDEAAYAASGASTQVDRALDDRHVTRFADFDPNPSAEAIDRGHTLYCEKPCDTVIAIGGGTAIDIAKLIAVSSSSDGDCRKLALNPDPIDPDRPTLVAIPTTAGTGSEATHFAVVYIDGVKYSIAHPAIRPDVAIVDPELTHSLPPAITAHTGLDALCQAIESLWSVQSDTNSRRFATRALDLAAAHLETAVTDPSLEARAAMSDAAHLAGKAIDISFTTGAHAVSYKLTSAFGVPHGLAVALTLGAWVRYNGSVEKHDCLDPRGIDSVRAAIETVSHSFGKNTVEEAADRFAALLRAIGCPTRLSDVGVGADDIDALAASVNVDRLANNPRRVTLESLRQLLSECL